MKKHTRHEDWSSYNFTEKRKIVSKIDRVALRRVARMHKVKIQDVEFSFFREGVKSPYCEDYKLQTREALEQYKRGTLVITI